MDISACGLLLDLSIVLDASKAYNTEKDWEVIKMFILDILSDLNAVGKDQFVGSFFCFLLITIAKDRDLLFFKNQLAI